VTPVRVGIVGAGRFTRLWHLPKLAATGAATVVALADPDPAALTDTAADLSGVATYADPDVMLASTDLDAVIVATPHAAHAAHVRAALLAGRHVLVDKPVATTAAEIQALDELAARHGLCLEVGYQRRYSPEFRALRRAVVGGLLGPPVLAVAILVHGWVDRYAGQWRQQPAVGGGGILTDSGRHLVDVVLWVVGDEPVSVAASIDWEGRPFEVAAALTVTFRGGARAQIDIDGRVPSGHWHEEFAVWGRDGGLGLRDGALRRIGGAPAACDGEPNDGAASPEEHFCDAIRGLRPPGVGALDDLRVARLLETAIAAAAVGRTLPYTDHPRRLTGVQRPPDPVDGD
jgi:predicted dehydrogenase